MTKTLVLALLLLALPHASAQNETSAGTTLSEADLDAIDTVVTARVLPAYDEMAQLREVFADQTQAMERLLAGMRKDVAALDANLSTVQATQSAVLQDEVAAVTSALEILEARIGAVENTTSSLDGLLASGDVQVQVDGDQVETAVRNVVAGPAFQSRLENGVRKANDDVATQDDVAAVVQAQPAWWIPWSATLALAVAAAVYHQRVVRQLMGGREPRDEEEDAEDDETEDDGGFEYVVPDEDLEDARERMRELARNTILAPRNGMQTDQVGPQPNGVEHRPVMEVAKDHAEPSEGEEALTDSDQSEADDAPTAPRANQVAQAKQVHAAQAAKEPQLQDSAPQGDDPVVQVVPEGEGQASGPEPAERDAAAPARRHWQAYQEGKLDGEALQFALADAYPDVDERQLMLQQAKETT